MTSQVCILGSPTQLVGLAHHDQAVLAHPQVTAMVMSPPADRRQRESISELRQAADRHDVAFLVADDLELLDQVMADGIEIDWNYDGFAAARERLGDGRSIGCRVGLSRHFAMEAAEAGADYIHFCSGQPMQSESMTITEMAQWWMPIFEVPCMASAGDDAKEWANLAAANVDFVALEADIVAKGLQALMSVQSSCRDATR